MSDESELFQAYQDYIADVLEAAKDTLCNDDLALKRKRRAAGEMYEALENLKIQAENLRDSYDGGHHGIPD